MCLLVEYARAVADLVAQLAARLQLRPPQVGSYELSITMYGFTTFVQRLKQVPHKGAKVQVWSPGTAAAREYLLDVASTRKGGFDPYPHISKEDLAKHRATVRALVDDIDKHPLGDADLKGSCCETTHAAFHACDHLWCLRGNPEDYDDPGDYFEDPRNYYEDLKVPERDADGLTPYQRTGIICLKCRVKGCELQKGRLKEYSRAITLLLSNCGTVCGTTGNTVGDDRSLSTTEGYDHLLMIAQDAEAAAKAEDAKAAAVVTEASRAAAATAVQRGWGPALTQTTNPLLHAPGDIAVKIACHLGSPVDLLRLAIACKCTRSVANEAARRWLAGLGGPRPSAWLGLMHEIQTKERKATDDAIMNKIRGVIDVGVAKRMASNRNVCSYKQLSKETVLVLKQQGCMNKLSDGKLSRVATEYIGRALLELECLV